MNADSSNCVTRNTRYQYTADAQRGYLTSLKRSVTRAPEAEEPAHLKAIVTSSTPAGFNPNILQANAIDRYSRIIFPVVFVVFCCIYWVVYTNASPNVNLDGFVIN
jgi:hypothetical protein